VICNEYFPAVISVFPVEWFSCQRKACDRMQRVHCTVI